MKTKKSQLCAKLLSLCTVALILTGCGSTPNHFIDAAATNQITSTQAFVTVPQKEITAEVEASQVAAAGGGGLLLALIDVAVESNRAKTAEELVQPIKDSLVDIDFNELFVAELNKNLKSVDWLNVENVQLNADLTQNLREENFAMADSDAVLFVNAGYSLSSNFSSLKGYASVSLLPKTEELKLFSEKPSTKNAKKSEWHIDNNLYRDRVMTSVNLLTTTDKENNAAQLKDEPEKIRSEIKKLAAELAIQIASSIRNTRSAEKA